MRASTSRCATDLSRPYFAARWVTRSSLFLSEHRSSSENLPHLARISLITICLVSAADGPGSTSETYDPGPLPDRRSVGIESETTQTGIDWGHPEGSALLTRGSRLRVG